MVSFKPTILAIVIIQCSSNIKATNIFMPDCSQEVDRSSAECVCRLPKNWRMDICQGPKWFNNDQIHHRIINGETVDANVYPWFARAVDKSSGNWGGCGGSLVTSEYVLTAAHCVVDSIDDLKRNGGYQVGALCAPYGPSNSKNCGQKVESFGISEIIPHPNYDDGTVVNDFALIRLDGESSIIPVKMDEGNISPGYENLNVKSNLWPIGFGTTERGDISSKLMHVNVNYVKQSTCNSNYSGAITDEMMCAADTNQDSCQGDSGGPLYDSDNSSLVGVVSWGQGCAEANFPGVYARISDQFSWIQQVICAAHGNPKPSFCDDNPPPTSPPNNPPPPTPTPPTPGPPGCLDSPENWYDSDGQFYNCNWYAETGNCAELGDGFSNFGKTANQACCECGGGSTGEGPGPSPPTKSPIHSTTSSPTKSPTESPTKSPTRLPSEPSSVSPSSSECVNSPIDWHDSDNSVFDCNWYAQGDNCGSFGDGYANNGATANQACCACGGGSRGSGPSQPTPAPPGTNPCPSGQMLLEVEVITDTYGETENLFKLKEKNNYFWNEIWKENSFQSDSVQSYQQCLSTSKCYKFIMMDNYADGMCCTHGDGGYTLLWGGTLLKESDFMDGTREETKINC